MMKQIQTTRREFVKKSGSAVASIIIEYSRSIIKTPPVTYFFNPAAFKIALQVPVGISFEP